MKKLNLKNTNLPWLESRTILLTKTGSHAYGTNIRNSDLDYKGVCVPPIEYYLGLESFNEYNNSGGKNFKNTGDDVDVNIIHINKFVKDAMQGVPNNIEILFTRPEDVVRMTGAGKVLVDNRHLFLSKQIYKKMGGYAWSQFQKLKNKKSNGAGRQDLIQRYGYDTKFASHSVRLLTSAIEILETGDFSTYRPNREILVDIRTGRYTFDEVVSMIELYDDELKKAVERSSLPKRPDYHKINELLIEINKASLSFYD